MNILIREKDENIDERILFEKEINLFKECPYIFEKDFNNNNFLKFMDYLIENIGITKESKVYFYGKNLRIWSYIIMFAYVDEKIKLFYKGDEIEESLILRLDMKNNGFTSNDILSELEIIEYEKLPEYLKNLYYKDGDQIKLSKLGEIYVKNIRD